MENNIKRVELTTREKYGKAKSIKKDLKPKTYKGTGLRAHEVEGRKKKAQPAKIKKSKGVSSGKNWAWILRGCQGLGILEMCSTARM